MSNTAQSAGESSKSQTASAATKSTSTSTVEFVKSDRSTSGDWPGVYGADGYNIINDSVSYPAYAQVSPTGNNPHIWANSTAAAHAPRKAAGGSLDRIAACWYNATSQSIDLNLTDGNVHQVSLYLLDFDYAGRSLTLTIADAATGETLDSRSVSMFPFGVYEVWNIGGHVTITITNTAGSNGVLSGLFFDPASTAPSDMSILGGNGETPVPRTDFPPVSREERLDDGAMFAIEVDHLTKDFRVLHRAHASLKTAAVQVVKSLLQRSTGAGFDVHRVLDDISFNAKQGEAIAIFGRNGSGKSTLLSVLSRVYLPTMGSVTLRGRMISLLELGAGFNPELTGEENVYFNAAILGLTPAQAEEAYADIVKFSELSPKTLDLPVRMYSSGMQLRLGFSVAVHMNADILLLDEGIAVGDAGFRRKCYDKLMEFKARGKTMMCVTHGVDFIEWLCDRAIWLDNGKIVLDGPTAEVAQRYKESF